MLDKILQKLWSVIEFIMLLSLWPILIWVSVGIAILFNISADMAMKITIGASLILVGLYIICKVRVTLKELKVPKVFLILFGWLGPLCLFWIGWAIIFN